YQEIMSRQNQLQDTQTLLRQATKDLTETRKTVKKYRDQAQLLAETQQKIKNLEMSFEEETEKTKNVKGFSSSIHQNNHDDIDKIFAVQKTDSSSGADLTGDSALQQQQQQQRQQDRGTDMSHMKSIEQELVQLRSRVNAYKKN